MRTRPRAVAAWLPLAALASLPGCPKAPTAPPPVAAPAVFVPPLHDAEPGEQLRLRRGNEDWVWRVTSATDEEVEVEFTIFREGVAVGTPDRMRFDRNGLGIPRDPYFVVREIRRDRIEAGGRGWDCWLIRAHSRAGIRYYWVTDELPVHGVVRMAIDDRGRPVLASAADVLPEGSSFPK